MSLCEAKLRILALSVETATATLGVPVDGSVDFFHTQESFPYFVLRTGEATHDYDSERFRTIDRTIIIRFVVGHLTEGYRGERQAWVDAIIAPLVAVFDSDDGRFLVSAAYPARPVYLDTLGVETTGDTGLMVPLEHAGIKHFQVGTEISLLVPFRQDTREA